MKEQVPSIKNIGKVTYRLDEIDSTNNFAKRMIANGAPFHGTAILADFQTNGRGQLGKKWQAVAGQNLLCSIILKPNSSVNTQFYLNKAMAIAVANTVTHFVAEDQVYIKWPNDILVAHKKISGLLIENTLMGKNLRYCVVGVGLNVNQMQFNNGVRATSLAILLREAIKRKEVEQVLFAEIEKWWQMFQNQNFDEIDTVYHQNLFGYKQEQLFEKEGQTYSGIIQGVDENGRLIVECDGQVQQYRNQDVKFVIF